MRPYTKEELELMYHDSLELIIIGLQVLNEDLEQENQQLREGLKEIDDTAIKHMKILPSGTDHQLSSVVGLMGCIARSTLEMAKEGAVHKDETP